MSLDTLEQGPNTAITQLELRTDRMIATKEGAIGWIVFNNPARRNAVSVAMWEALREIVEDYARDDSIRVIVVRGAGGKAFVSGADISEFEQQRSTPESTEAYRQLSEAATMTLHYVNKPTIAMIEGFCIGGGVSLALSCDIRIAETGARFGVPAARLGLGYELPGVRKLVDIVGPSFAKEIFFTARQFTSDEARDMGLVNRVVAPDELEGYVREYAATIADNAPLTVGSIKTIVGEILKDDDKRDEALCDRVVDQCFNSEDYIEGRRAFMEKRPARFTGR
jgi:enoyl-CoA hydratase